MISGLLFWLSVGTGPRSLDARIQGRLGR